MKKEIVFAVIIGLVVGLIITFGVYRARRAVSDSTTINVDSATPTPTPISSQKESFLLTEPVDETLTTESQTRVSGQTFPNAVIIVLTQSGETVGQADSQGNFSLNVPLLAGANLLTIRVSGDNQDTKEVTRTVVLSTADLEASSSATAKPTTTPKVTPKASPKL